MTTGLQRQLDELRHQLEVMRQERDDAHEASMKHLRQGAEVLAERDAARAENAELRLQIEDLRKWRQANSTGLACGRHHWVLKPNATNVYCDRCGFFPGPDSSAITTSPNPRGKDHPLLPAFIPFEPAIRNERGITWERHAVGSIEKGLTGCGMDYLNWVGSPSPSDTVVNCPVCLP